MMVYAFLGRFLFTSILLIYAAWGDLSKREVENWVPVALVIGGIGFAVYDSVFSGEVLPVLLALASGGIGFAIALAIFHAGSMGGADCKIFIGVSALFPLMITSPLPLLGELNPLVEGTRRVLPMFSLSWLVNSLLISLIVPVGLFAKNIHDFARGRMPEVGRRTIPAFFVGYRTRVRNLRPSFLIPLERFEEVDGRTVRVLRYTRGVLEESEEEKIIREVRKHIPGDELIWAFPYLPFIVPMLVAFFVTIFLGDLLVNLVTFL